MLSVAPALCLDFGTGRTRVSLNGRQMLFDEPTILSVDESTGRIVATGQAALEQYGRAAPNIQFLHPVRGGVVADYAAALYFLKKIFSRAQVRARLFRPTVLAAAPAEMTSVEERALTDVIREAGARDIYIMPGPLVSYLYLTREGEQRTGGMIVDIGAGTADIAVLSAGEILFGETVHIGGDSVVEMISRFLEVSYRVKPGRFGAEDIMKSVGVADYGPDETLIQRRTATRDFPAEEVQAPLTDLVAYLKRGLQPLADGILATLEKTPPELCTDIYHNGVRLTGGAARIPGLANWIGRLLRLETIVAEEPEKTVIQGLNLILKKRKQYLN